MMLPRRRSYGAIGSPRPSVIGGFIKATAFTNSRRNPRRNRPLERPRLSQSPLAPRIKRSSGRSCSTLWTRVGATTSSRATHRSRRMNGLVAAHAGDRRANRQPSRSNLPASAARADLRAAPPQPHSPNGSVVYPLTTTWSSDSARQSPSRTSPMSDLSRAASACCARRCTGSAQKR